MRLSLVVRSSVIIGLCGFFTVRASAQQLKLGDNPSTLRRDAILELNTNNQGLLLPRVPLSQIQTGGRLANAPNGMLVYVTDAAENAMYIRRFNIWQKVGDFSATSISGDVTATGTGAITTSIVNGAVTLAKMQNINSQRILGRYAAGSGVTQEIQLGTNLLLNNTTGILLADNISALWNANSLQSRSVSATAPADGDVLKYNSTSGAWEPSAAGTGITSLNGSIIANGSGAVTAYIQDGAVAYVKIQQMPAQTLMGNFKSTQDVVAPISIGSGLALNATTGVLSATAGTAMWNASQLRGRAVGNTAPTTGQVLKWNGTNWDAAADAGGTGTITLTGPVTGTSSTGTVATTITDEAVTYAKIQNVTTQRLLGRYTAGSGVTQEVSLGSTLGLNATTGVLSANNTSALWNASQLQGRAITTGTPTNGQVLKYNTTNSTWDLAEDLSGGATYGTLGDNNIANADAPDAFSRMKIWASNGTNIVTNGPSGTSAYSWNVLSFRGAGYTTQLYFDKSTLAVKEWGGNAATLTTNAENPWYKVLMVHGSTDIANGSILFGGKTENASAEAMQDNSRLFWNNTSKRLGIGTNTPNSTMQIAGSIAETLTIVNSNTTLTEAMNTLVVRRNGGGTANITVTIPQASTCPGRVYTIIKDYTGGASGNMNLSFASGEGPSFSTSYGNGAVVIKLMSVGNKWARVLYVDNGVF
ncbi:hypothetical protein MKQ68_17775 [Chitinophaga horti]|uniref:Uncharacterized protein n=1 Tax=Chitinophaga horti TaxID=2920382 RepID=A0ABY6J1B0_9BACT|nr:hypothetical protein [Chitinophaga horti]UYQ91937.1 hypothetical protein MKQ68_17775 [Chitinophaga horti]